MATEVDSRIRVMEEALCDPSPATIRGIAETAEELRLRQPSQAPKFSAAAVRALDRLGAQECLRAEVWAIHGSALRASGRFAEAEMALLTAANWATDQRTQADVARRLSILRAEQGRAEEARALLSAVLDWAKVIGGRTYGEQLAGASAVLGFLHDFEGAKLMAIDALRYLPPIGDRCHISTVFNLGHFCLELAIDEADLEEASALIRQAERLVGVDDYTGTKMLWLRARLNLRSGEAKKALRLLEAAWPEIEDAGNPIDLAILLVDVADTHLELGDYDHACQPIRKGFPLLRPLQNKPEAFQALRSIMRIAERGELCSRTLLETRRTLEAN